MLLNWITLGGKVNEKLGLLKRIIWYFTSINYRNIYRSINKKGEWRFTAKILISKAVQIKKLVNGFKRCYCFYGC